LKALLDTNILSALMRRHPGVLLRAQEYLATHSYLTFSVVNRYEILRGLKVKEATRQIATFESFCESSEVLPLPDAVFVRAAGIYSELHRRGELIEDADILIAATAQHHGLEVITHNTAHFERITGLTVHDWLV
jgi:tRNA(fMet)-specific endonuclease VapC